MMTRRLTSRVLISVLAIVAAASAAAAQSAADQQEHRKVALEIEKLQLEIDKLKEPDLPTWLFTVLGVLGGAAGTLATLYVARREQLGALDQSVHESRLTRYPKLVNATAPLALYFPGDSFSGRSLSPADCMSVGQKLSNWYFDDGGLLLSEESRRAYFSLQRALTRAVLAPNLKMPVFPADGASVSFDKMKEYQSLWGLDVLDDIEHWPFGGESQTGEPKHQAFKDFVFLQRLCSQLRTTLSEDLRSRRRPAD